MRVLVRRLPTLLATSGLLCAAGQAHAEEPAKAPAVTSKPAAQAPARKRVVLRAKQARGARTALATYPGFRVLSDGRSELTLRVSKRVNVQMQRANGRVSFSLPGVGVGVRNNTNPLVTTHFDTPLSRARLATDGHGAELILELREAVVPTFAVTDAPGGVMLLVVTLPKASQVYSLNREPLPPRDVPPGKTDSAGDAR